MFHTAKRRLRALGPVVAMLVAFMSVAAPVSARQLVDPASLTPPIPLTSHPVCSWVGAQVMCSSDRNVTVTDASTGIICEDGEILESSERHVFGHRYFNSDLYLVES